jgi:GNAT superfamily N-acetyltransferase
MIEIRRMRPVEKEEVVALSKSLNRFVKDFGSIWTRWKMWDKSPPFVALVDGKIVGFHGASFLKKDYVYTMYIGVSPEVGGKGIASALTWAAIEHAKTLGLTRFTAKADTRGGGYAFYTGLGMKPVARKKTEYVFDCEFGDSKDMAEFRVRLKDGTACTPPSARKAELYKKTSEELFF